MIIDKEILLDLKLKLCGLGLIQLKNMVNVNSIMYILCQYIVKFTFLKWDLGYPLIFNSRLGVFSLLITIKKILIQIWAQLD